MWAWKPVLPTRLVFHCIVSRLLAPVVGLRPYHTREVGTNCDKASVAESVCLEAARSVLPEGKTSIARKLRTVDLEDAPPGCSVHVIDDFAVVFNRQKGQNDGTYIPVCEGLRQKASSCKVPRIDADGFSDAQFVRDYLGRSPVIITGGSLPWIEGERAHNWNMDAMVDLYGGYSVPLRDPEQFHERGPRLARHLGDEDDLKSYAQGATQDNEPIGFYEFGWNSQLTRSVRANLDHHAIVGVGRFRLRPILTIGGKGVGSSLTSSPEHWLAELHGARRWFLTMDNSSTMKPPFRYDPCTFEEFPPSSPDIQRCDTKPGDAIYLPAGSWYANCNLDEWTVAFGGSGDTKGLPDAHASVLNNDPDGLDKVAMDAGPRALSEQAGDELVTPAHIAATSGNPLMLGRLKKHGADLNVEADGISTPLMLASAWGHLEVLQWFSEHGFDVWAADQALKNTALHHASENGHVVVAKWLLQQPGAVPLAVNNRMQTPLHLSSAAGHIEVTELLVQANASAKDIRDRRGRTPLDLAIQYRETNVARLLGAQFVPGADDEEDFSAADTREDMEDSERAIDQELDEAWRGRIHSRDNSGRNEL